MNELRLEVWFPREREVTVSLASSAGEEEEARLEAQLFAFFAARLIVNLRGRGIVLAMSLAEVEEAAPLDYLEMQLGDLQFSSPKTDGEQQKGFVAELKGAPRSGAFTLDARGFGILARGVDYYAPMATLAVLAWLLRQRADDQAYGKALAATARLVGTARRNGDLTLRSQVGVAVRAADAAWAEAHNTFGLTYEAIVELESAGLDFAELIEGVRKRLDQAVGAMNLSETETAEMRGRLLDLHCCYELLEAVGGDVESVTEAWTAMEGAEASGDKAALDAAHTHLISTAMAVLSEHGLRVAHWELSNAVST